MKVLTFLASNFGWTSDTPEREDPLAGGLKGTVQDCLVAFVQLEAADLDQGPSVTRKFLKHVKWQARKREVQRVVLHSFAHLGAEQSAPQTDALAFFEELLTRLAAAGFATHATPFGHSCAWDLSVHGEPIAKVWKQI